ncbi:restriction endonuclease subunit S [Aerolutibacter ruishenii]|uniref:Type I restriction enzyme S subunit n=1 Tax=Aerolutibacter ruishenii TaxID=686800 RepID=A0A562LRQ5_9GAMM|nr:restriction endonuclease subunit S [Lysobacter ruishenii]TWI10321.1 type I restriction enzyme S subunit [Lysobacter ruishenii]
MAFTAKIADLIAEDRTGLLTKHESWERVPLSEVASILNGAPFDSAMFNSTGGLPLARIRDVMAGRTSTYYTGEYEDAYLLGQGDLLVGMDGDFNTGYWGAQIALLNQRVCKLTPTSELYDKALLGYVLPGYLAAINANTPSITVKHLSSKTIGEIELPLPPRAEQTRIVEKLEELLSDLDAGVTELKSAQRKLVQYRQSLLKAAVEGALTADWRTARDQSQETGAELLQRILTERRARWAQMQLARFAEQGKTPPKDWQTKYPEPVAPNTADLPPLPDGWVWSTIDQLSIHVRNGLSQKPTQEPIGYPILRINAVRPMTVNLDEVRYLHLPREDAAPYLLANGDLLATRYNGSVDLLGVVGVVRGVSRDIVHPDKLIRIRPVLGAHLADWIEIVASTGVSRAHIVSRVKTTAGQTGISGNDLKRMPIPLPGLAEQAAITSMVRAAIDGVNGQQQAVDMSLAQSSAQRKNLLTTAFAGQLVPQDSNDEPASALLARIRAEREAAPNSRSRRGAGSKPSAADRTPRQGRRSRKAKEAE